MATESNTKPLAFFITFTCKGTWLHGDPKGSVDSDHNQVGTPFLEANSELQRSEMGLLKAKPYHLDDARRRIALQGILEAATKRGWNLLAVHVRSNHVHVVVHAVQSPERVMNDCKAYASKHLNLAFPEEREIARWTRHGSTRYLWTEERVADAIDYVLNRQGDPMERYQSEPRTQ